MRHLVLPEGVPDVSRTAYLGATVGFFMRYPCWLKGRNSGKRHRDLTYIHKINDL